MTAENRDAEEAVAGLGTPVEPEVREGANKSEGDRPECSGDKRRFVCTECETGSRLLAMAELSFDRAGEDGPERSIRVICSECNAATRHEPDHGRPLGYWRRRGALQRRRANRQVATDGSESA